MEGFPGPLAHNPTPDKGVGGLGGLLAEARRQRQRLRATKSFAAISVRVRANSQVFGSRNSLLATRQSALFGGC